jgi:hypothetical protein
MQALLPVVLVLAGCHTLIPHTPAETGADRSAREAAVDAPRDHGMPGPEQGRPDVPVLDAAWTPDAASADLKKPDAAKVDLKKLDAAKVDLKKTDLAKPDLPKADLKKPDAKLDLDLPACFEQSTINSSAATCAGQCTSLVGDGDCDGIPNGRDPAATTCNRLLSFEHFTATSPSTKWTSGGTGTWPCGAASLVAGASLTLSAGELAKITSGKFLIEAKYTLGEDPSNDWAVRLNFQKAGDPTKSFNCEQWVSTTYGGKGTHHLNDHYCGNSGTWNTSLVFDVTPGKTYFLQLYSNASAVYCRVITESGTVSSGSYACVVGAPANLYLATTRAITVDHLRIFQY